MKLRYLPYFLLLAFGALLARAQDASGIHTRADEPPVPLRTVSPVAPEGQTGLVAVVVVIDEEGKVLSTAVSKSTNPQLDEPAATAIQGWTFKPAMKAGKPVKIKVTLPVRFDAKHS